MQKVSNLDNVLVLVFAGFVFAEIVVRFIIHHIAKKSFYSQGYVVQ